MITAEKSRFYCPEERKLHGNGNKYDLTIDNIIIQTLYTNKSLTTENSSPQWRKNMTNHIFDPIVIVLKI